MAKRLQRQFYTKPTLQVAESLLGKVLICVRGNTIIRGIINETEAYKGPADKGAHMHLTSEKNTTLTKKKLLRDFIDEVPEWQRQEFEKNYLRRGGKITPRTLPIFLKGGHVYVYLIYGMYYNLNISTKHAGFGEGVLIRGVRPLEESPVIPDGPGKLCNYYGIDKSFNMIDLTESDTIWIEDHNISPKKISRTPRVGIDYAEEYKDKNWRFVLDF